MVVRFQTFEQFHNRKHIGSTQIRVHNLLKHWPGAGLYKYGEKADVMIFQKVYNTFDYKFPTNYPGIKILDVCDPDWMDAPDYYIKETIDGMDAVVVPTESLKKLLETMTDTPIRVIKDRFELTEFPAPKPHTQKAKTIVWFGYSHNAELLKSAVPSLEKRGLNLIVISNQDPFASRWGQDYDKHYKFIKWDDNAYKNIQLGDICILPKGFRPKDRFKSENKTTISRLLGIPVATDANELDKLLDPVQRQTEVNNWYNKTREEYNVKISVDEYKDLIRSLQQ